MGGRNWADQSKEYGISWGWVIQEKIQGREGEKNLGLCTSAMPWKFQWSKRKDVVKSDCVLNKPNSINQKYCGRFHFFNVYCFLFQAVEHRN